MNSAIHQWAIRNRVSLQALEELRVIFGMEDPGAVAVLATPTSEAAVQSLVRIEGVQKGVTLWRNNVGALLDERGVPVRYGLANDSKQLNAKLKSGDLIGWRSITVTPEMVGARLAQFVSRECKRPGWRYSGTDREQAQQKWAELVNAAGGDAKFVTGQGTL